jgi:hypothetical protein
MTKPRKPAPQRKTSSRRAQLKATTSVAQQRMWILERDDLHYANELRGRLGFPAMALPNPAHDTAAAARNDPEALKGFAEQTLAAFPSPPASPDSKSVADYFGRSATCMQFYSASLHEFVSTIQEMSYGTALPVDISVALNNIECDHFRRSAHLPWPTYTLRHEPNAAGSAPFVERAPVVYHRSWAFTAQQPLPKPATKQQVWNRDRHALLASGRPTQDALTHIAHAWPAATLEQLRRDDKLLVDLLRRFTLRPMTAMLRSAHRPDVLVAPESFRARIVGAMPSPPEWIARRKLMKAAGCDPDSGRHRQYMALLAKPGGPLESNKKYGYRLRCPRGSA